ncbi:MAG: serine hydrolase domain-containing protein [Chloroflexota bacterium]
MADFTKEVDQLLAKWDKTTSPGCAIAIIHNGEVVHKQGYGMANLELNVPITPSSVFYLASVSKQFAAMAIALLVEMGKITLADDIRQYLPELPDYCDSITIDHLVRHTSGLRDYLNLGSLAGKKSEDVWTEKELLEMLIRQKGLNFLPGDQYAYSNSGYVLLTVIVKRVTGQSMQAFSKEHMFKPLGMRHTVFKEDHQLVIPNRTAGYSRKANNGFVNEFHNLQVVGDGGLYSNVEDLILWDQNFYHNRLGKGTQALLDLVHSTKTLNDGSKHTYAFGLEHETYRGLNAVAHSGGLNGARTHMKRFPKQNFTVICLSNLSDFAPEEVSYKITDIYLSDHLQPIQSDIDTKPAKPAEHESESLADKVGLYRNPKTGIIRQVKFQDDQLVVLINTEFVVPLQPMGKNHFKALGFPVEALFEPFQSEGRFQMLEIFGDNPAMVYEPAESAKPTADALVEYCGTYHSIELETDYSLEIDEGNLMLRHRKIADNQLLPTIEDGFMGNRFEILFARNEDNSIAGFTLNSDRIRNIFFTLR